MSGSVYCSKRCANTRLLRQILCAARFAINLHLIANIRTLAAHGKWYRPLPVFTDNVLWINPCNRIELSQFFLIVSPAHDTILLIITFHARSNTVGGSVPHTWETERSYFPYLQQRSTRWRITAAGLTAFFFYSFFSPLSPSSFRPQKCNAKSVGYSTMIQGKAWYKTPGAQVGSGCLCVISVGRRVFYCLRRRQFAVFQDRT